jgi:hypothetical protein
MVTDRVPSERWPRYTRSNSGEVLPTPASPLGQHSSWEGGICVRSPAVKVEELDLVFFGDHPDEPPHFPHPAGVA